MDFRGGGSSTKKSAYYSMTASSSLSRVYGCGYTYNNWFVFTTTYQLARPIIVQYDLNLNFKWAKAYDMTG